MTDMSYQTDMFCFAYQNKHMYTLQTYEYMHLRALDLFHFSNRYSANTTKLRQRQANIAFYRKSSTINCVDASLDSRHVINTFTRVDERKRPTNNSFDQRCFDKSRHFSFHKFSYSLCVCSRIYSLAEWRRARHVDNLNHLFC